MTLGYRTCVCILFCLMWTVAGDRATPETQKLEHTCQKSDTADQLKQSNRADPVQVEECESMVRYFLRDADVEAVLTNALCAKVMHYLQKAGNKSDRQGPTETLSCILNLTELDFAEAFSLALPKALFAHQQILLQRQSNESSESAESAENGKFVPEAAFGDPSHFHKGLEIIGLPSPRIEDAMQNEFNFKTIPYKNSRLGIPARILHFLRRNGILS